MEERLRDGYTFYYSLFNGNDSGGYLKRTDFGLCGLELCGNEQVLLTNFPNVLQRLNSGNTLQMYFGDVCHMFTMMIGKENREGPYGEEASFSDVFLFYGTSPITVLEEADQILAKNTGQNKQLKKAYRLYGQDRYQFYTSK